MAKNPNHKLFVPRKGIRHPSKYHRFNRKFYLEVKKYARVVFGKEHVPSNLTEFKSWLKDQLTSDSFRGWALDELLYGTWYFDPEYVYLYFLKSGAIDHKWRMSERV